MIESGRASRAGLLATNSLPMMGNRPVLESIKRTGDIFMAWSDRPWVLDGAAVRVSMVGFDGGKEKERSLDGQSVTAINCDLTSGADVTSATDLPENEGLCFLGVMKGGPFDVSDEVAKKMLAAPENTNGRKNSDVVRRRLGAQDITARGDMGCIIDFNEMPVEQAAQYELPFEYVKTHVKSLRDVNRDVRMRTKWWIHGRSRPALRKAITGLKRCVITPEVAKHRIFVWMPTDVVPDHTCHVIAREDDYFFGVLHSKTHTVWTLAQCSWMGVGNDPRYSSSKTFDTFPFPWPPGREPNDDPRVEAIASAARSLVEARDRWLNPKNAVPEELAKRTLTNLYNERPTWLEDLHRSLDKAVLAAYGWPEDSSDDDLLAALLSLNHERGK